MRIRFKYERNEPVKYVGHLDVMSMFDRVFRRCNIQVEFSQGFTQRSQIIFALPSSVGIISKCELFEVEVPNINKDDIESIKNSLNEKLPIGFNIISAIEVYDNSSIMAKVECAEYEIIIQSDKECLDKMKEIFAQDRIFIKRIAKNNIEYDMNIKPYILDIKINNSIDKIIINTKLKSGSRENLKPDYIIQAIQNGNINIVDYEIIKTNVILNE